MTSQTSDISSHDAVRYIHNLADTDPVYESPINVNIAKTTEIELPPLTWHNLELPPKKMKVTNTGYTLILSAKWHQERPYISDGPLLGNYVFSQLHFHWGKDDSEGSEHTIDGARHPIEMHVVFFKANYLTQESALKEKDGIVVLVYIFKLQSGKNPAFQILVDDILSIQKAHMFRKLDPLPLSVFIKKFDKDYFLYWGSVTTTDCIHCVLWFISRLPVGVAAEQLQHSKNPTFQTLINDIRVIQKAHTSVKLDPLPLSDFVKKFHKDYFLYWGSVTTTVCLHYVLWLISRAPVGVAREQVHELRSMLDASDEPLQGNFRDIQIDQRKVFHVSPSTSKDSTLFALP